MFYAKQFLLTKGYTMQFIILTGKKIVSGSGRSVASMRNVKCTVYSTNL